MLVTPSLRWQVPVAVSGVVLVVAGSFAPLAASVGLAALGGLLLGAALAPLALWPGPAVVDASQTEQLEAMANAFQEGLLDLYSLYEVGRTVSASLDLDQLLTTTMKRVATTTGIESYALLLVDEDKNAITVRSATGIGGAVQRAVLPAGEGLAGRVCRSRAPEMHTGLAPLPWTDVPRAARSVIAIPLAGRERVLGALEIFSRSPSAFSERELAYFTAVGKQLSIAIENAVRHQRATEMSYHDPLTGLFNRRYLEEALDTEVRRAARYSLPLSVNIVDIDHFKSYNDTHGHGRGDKVLRAVATRLSELIRNADIVARYGGEEFVILLPMTTKAHARLVGEKLRNAIAGTPVGNGAGDLVTISVGVATFPADATTAVGLLQAADAALYAAKDSGRNRVEVFNDSAIE